MRKGIRRELLADMRGFRSVKTNLGEHSRRKLRSQIAEGDAFDWNWMKNETAESRSKPSQTGTLNE